ncbi:MAG: outer membrane lipoprotein-sorting protein [Verrucomicrobiaceae bacterium]|nr:outer membrane lipoprotein-sorting protein [Verrucomicrobiaceae bacterium]
MNKFLLITVAVTLASSGPLARAEERINAEELLRAVRHSTAQNEELTLKGQLREGRKKHPFRMTIRRTQIAFLFEDKPPHTVVLDLGADRFRLRENHSNGPFTDVAPGDYGKPIRNSGVNYLDISLAYLYWPDPKYIKEDVVSERITHLVEVQNPSATGPYAKLLIWIDRQTGGLMRMQGYNKAGKLTKRMQVIEVQRVKRGEKKYWALEKMQIYTLDPKTGRVRSRTYMELDK